MGSLSIVLKHLVQSQTCVEWCGVYVEKVFTVVEFDLSGEVQWCVLYPHSPPVQSSGVCCVTHSPPVQSSDVCCTHTVLQSSPVVCVVPTQSSSLVQWYVLYPHSPPVLWEVCIGG